MSIVLIKDYRVVDSGDPEAPWEVISPDGRTVSIVENKREARRAIVGDIAEQIHARNPNYLRE